MIGHNPLPCIPTTVDGNLKEKDNNLNLKKMMKLEDFKEFNLSLQSLHSLIGGIDEGHAIGCVGCDGNTTYCPNSSSCETISCPQGNDVGGNKAKGCGSSSQMP